MTQTSPVVSEAGVTTIPSFQVCAGVGCTTLVRLYRFCDACLTTTAIELARRFELSCMEACQLCDGEAGTDAELRAMLAGIAQTRPNEWYRLHSPLGPLSHCEAIILRTKTDMACFLVAQGGVAALRHLTNMPLPEPGPLADPESGEAPRRPHFPGKRPEHYVGQAFDAAAWGDQDVPEDTGGGLGRLFLGIASGAAGTLVLLVIVIGVLVW